LFLILFDYHYYSVFNFMTIILIKFKNYFKNFWFFTTFINLNFITFEKYFNLTHILFIMKPIMDHIKIFNCYHNYLWNLIIIKKNYVNYYKFCKIFTNCFYIAHWYILYKFSCHTESKYLAIFHLFWFINILSIFLLAYYFYLLKISNYF